MLLTSRIHPLIFLSTPKGYIYPESLLNIFLNLYIPPWLQTRSKFMVLKLLANTLVSQKLNLFIFTHFPIQNSPSIFYQLPLKAEQNYSFLPNSVFKSSISSSARSSMKCGGLLQLISIQSSNYMILQC